MHTFYRRMALYMFTLIYLRKRTFSGDSQLGQTLTRRRRLLVLLQIGALRSAICCKLMLVDDFDGSGLLYLHGFVGTHYSTKYRASSGIACEWLLNISGDLRECVGP